MTSIYTTKESIKSLLGKEVINQDRKAGVITEVDEAPGGAYPIKVTFESGAICKYTKYGYLHWDSEDYYIILTGRDKLENDLFRVIEENGSDAEELITILLDKFTTD